MAPRGRLARSYTAETATPVGAARSDGNRRTNENAARVVACRVSVAFMRISRRIGNTSRQQSAWQSCVNYVDTKIIIISEERRLFIVWRFVIHGVVYEREDDVARCCGNHTFELCA